MNIETKNELSQDQSEVEIDYAVLEAVAAGLPVRSKVRAGAGKYQGGCKAWTLE
jgi:hypothetical protein